VRVVEVFFEYVLYAFFNNVCRHWQYVSPCAFRSVWKKRRKSHEGDDGSLRPSTPSRTRRSNGVGGTLSLSPRTTTIYSRRPTVAIWLQSLHTSRLPPLPPRGSFFYSFVWCTFDSIICFPHVRFVGLLIWLLSVQTSWFYQIDIGTNGHITIDVFKDI